MNPNLIALIKDTLNHYNAGRSHSSINSSILKDALPVAWFGDTNAYFHSKRRIVTVGLNPKSGLNPNWHNISGLSMTSLNPASLYTVYNDYFIGNTVKRSVCSQWDANYLRWFKSLDTRLRQITISQSQSSRSTNLLEVSYNGQIASGSKSGTVNTAIHIDLFSTSPTTKVWSSLTSHVKSVIVNGLQPSGLSLFKRALAALNPDVVILGVGQASNAKLLANYFDPISTWPVQKSSVGNLCAAKTWIDLNHYCNTGGLNSNAELVWLKSQNKPFLGCSVVDAAKMF